MTQGCGCLISRTLQPCIHSHCTALLGMHAFTKCDTTSAFKGIGKMKTIKFLRKMPRYLAAFASLGESWEMLEELIDITEEFTCTMYGKPRLKSVNEGQIDYTPNVHMASLPPCRRCLIQHLKSVNYPIAIWKRANVPAPVIHDPVDGHGWVLVNGHIEYL